MLGEREGIAGIALLAMFADGVIAAEEDDVLRERLLLLPAFAGVDDDALGRVLSSVEKIGRDLGPEKMLHACAAALSASGRVAAYKVAAQIVVADADVAPEEDDYLALLREALALTPAEADRIHASAEAELA